VSVAARLEKPVVRAGESIKLQVTAEWSGNEKLQVYAPSSPDLDRFEITGIASAAAVVKNKERTVYKKIFTYTLHPKAAGKGRIGSVVLEYENGEQKRSVSTREISLEILPKPKSYAPVIKKVLAAILALAFIGVAGRAVLRYIKKGKTPSPVLVEKTLEEKILERIKAGETLTDGAEYFSLISTALREYLGEKFQIKAATSSAIQAALRERGTPPDFSDRVERILVACDAVKFAGHQPGKEKIQEIQNDFITLIKREGMQNV
jgi:hypothetical protein